MKPFLAVFLSMFLLSCSDPDVSFADMSLPGSDAAMAPRLSTMMDGKVLLSWVEPANESIPVSTLRFSIFDGEHWSAERDAAQGRDWFDNWADTAGVTALENGLLVAHWLQKNGKSTYAYEVRYSVSPDAGDTWTESRVAHEDGSASEHGFVSVISHDDGFDMFWLDGRRTLEEDGGMTLRMGRFDRSGERQLETEIDGLTCDCCPTDALRVGDDSLVVYRDRDSEERRDIFMAVISKNGDVSRHEVNDDAWVMPACPVNGPAIAVQGESIHVLWFTAANDQREIRHATGNTAGEFAEPQVVAMGDAQGRVDLLSTDRGLLGMWLAGQGDAGRIELAEFVAGRFEAPMVVRGMSVSRRVGYPQLGRLPGGDVLLVWTGGDGAPGLHGKRLMF